MSEISISKEEAKNVKDWLNRLKNTKNKYGNKKDCVITIIDDFNAYDDDLDMFIKALEYMEKLEKIEHIICDIGECEELEETIAEKIEKHCEYHRGDCNRCMVQRIEQILKG